MVLQYYAKTQKVVTFITCRREPEWDLAELNVDSQAENQSKGDDFDFVIAEGTPPMSETMNPLGNE